MIHHFLSSSMPVVSGTKIGLRWPYSADGSLLIQVYQLASDLTVQL